MKQIFILEDDDGIRELIEILLISQDYGVKSYPTAEEFKKGISTSKPDLILMDIMLPDGNGLDICKGLSEDTETSHIPVVLMSAHASVQNSKDYGARDFIAKPFDIEDLYARINLQFEQEA